MEWKTGAELIELLLKQGQAVSGMSASEAATALGFTKLSNGMFVKTATTTASNVVNFTGGTATEAFVAGESAITGGAVTTAANTAIVETATGTTATAGILSVAVPIGASLIAAITGYKIGNMVYEDNQEFFDNLTGPLMEFCAEGTVNLMALIDSDGNTYFDSRVCDIVNNHLKAYTNYLPTYNTAQTTSTNTLINIGCSQALHIMYNKFLLNYTAPCDLQFSEQAISNFTNYINTNYPNMLYTLSITGGIMISISANIYKPTPEFSYTVSKLTHTGSEYIDFDELSMRSYSNINIEYVSYTPSMVTNAELPYDFYSEVAKGYVKYNITVNPNMSMYPGNKAVIFKSIISYNKSVQLLMSNFSLLEQSTLPQGIDKFTPNITSGLNPLKLFTGLDSQNKPTFTPYYPVAIPLGDPLHLPEINPENDPTKTINPEVISPFIPGIQPYPQGTPALNPSANPKNSPLPNPIPDADPAPYPLPNPSVDPSLTPTTPSGTNPSKLPSPTDGGNSPTINTPVIPPLSSSATGLLHVYNPTNEQINAFGAWLWTTFSGDLIDTISKLFNNPMEAVIGLHEIFITPNTSGDSTIKAGFLDSNVSSKLVSDRYSQINCGSITVPEYWGNYLDYSPYTKTYCYLPFIGIVELSTDDIVGHGINITYKIDSFTGSCIAIITVAKTGYESIVYQYPGNCAVEIPITSGMKGALQSALIGAATSAIAVASGGGSVLATAALAGGAKSGLNSKNEVSHSGSFGSTYGAMGAKKPFIIVKRPVQKVVAGYNENYGYPAHTMVLVSSCTGYLRAKEVDVISVTATEEEKKLIETMLKSGVFVS